MSNLLTTDEFYYDYLKIDDANAVSDELKDYYDTILNSAESFLLKEVDRDFVSTEYTEKYSGMGTDFLVLKHYPVQSLSSVENYNTSNIKIQEKGVIVNTDTVFELGEYNIEITYTAGYSTIPEDIKRAVGLLGVALHDEHDRGDHRLNVFTQDKRDTLIEFNEDVVPVITQNVIDNYSDDRVIEIDYVSN